MSRALASALRELSLCLATVNHGDTTEERRFAYERAHAIHDFVETLITERGGDVAYTGLLSVEYPGE